MDFLSNLSLVWQTFLLGSGSSALGGLVPLFVQALLGAVRRQVRERLRTPESVQALQNAVAQACYRG